MLDDEGRESYLKQKEEHEEMNGSMKEHTVFRKCGYNFIWLERMAHRRIESKSEKGGFMVEKGTVGN